ncbi:MAG: acyl-CoA synthetase, partial [bacterium]
HPGVALAAVVGQPDGYAGELPVAYVQPNQGNQAGAEEMLAFVRQHCPERAANPVALHFLAALPLTAVGKVFKPQLRWDAARRVVTELLAPLAVDGVGVSVAVGGDATHGSLATVVLTGRQGPGREAVEASVAEILAPFVLRYRLEWH